MQFKNIWEWHFTRCGILLMCHITYIHVEIPTGSAHAYIGSIPAGGFYG